MPPSLELRSPLYILGNFLLIYGAVLHGLICCPMPFEAITTLLHLARDIN